MPPNEDRWRPSEMLVVLCSKSSFNMTKALVLVCLVTLTSLSASAQTIDGCPVFPQDNPWNLDISDHPVHPRSQVFIDRINENSNPTRRRLHPDFGSPREYGIPFVVVDGSQPMVQITYDAYGDESDPGPMPIPADAPIEGAPGATEGDRHVIVIDKTNCMLYELFAARKDAVGSGWTANSGAIFDLERNHYRPDGWTSADAAGLPIFPGLVRYDEVKSGEIRHALRFTVPRTQPGWIHPARHKAATSQDTNYPPMGLRLRLKESFDISGFSTDAQVVLRALKKYGMILADNGSPWFISGATDSRWDDDAIGDLKQVPGSEFEAVYTGEIKREPDQASVTVPENLVAFELTGNRVHNKSSEVATLRLLDIKGIVQYETTLPTSGNLNLEALEFSKGSYLLQVVSSRVSKVFKLHLRGR